MSGLAPFLRRRWPALLLAASLVLNAFFVGMLVADAFKPARQHGFSADRLARIELHRFDDRLPGPAVEQIASELQPLVPGLDKELADLRAIRADILMLAAAPAPDRTAIDGKLAALRAAAASMQERVQRTTFDALLKLPPETRAGLATAPAAP